MDAALHSATIPDISMILAARISNALMYPKFLQGILVLINISLEADEAKAVIVDSNISYGITHDSEY